MTTAERIRDAARWVLAIIAVAALCWFAAQS